MGSRSKTESKGPPTRPALYVTFPLSGSPSRRQRSPGRSFSNRLFRNARFQHQSGSTSHGRNQPSPQPAHSPRQPKQAKPQQAQGGGLRYVTGDAHIIVIRKRIHRIKGRAAQHQLVERAQRISQRGRQSRKTRGQDSKSSARMLSGVTGQHPPPQAVFVDNGSDLRKFFNVTLLTPRPNPPSRRR
jgi:hypothetical protein